MIAFMMEVQKYVFIITKFISESMKADKQIVIFFHLIQELLAKASFLITMPMAKILIKSVNATTPGMKLCETCKNQAREEHAYILAQKEQASKFANFLKISWNHYITN